MENYEVRYESTLWMDVLKINDNAVAAECFSRHGWNKFISVIPKFFLSHQVKRFYDTIRQDEATGVVTASFTYHTNPDHTHASTVEINVTEFARQYFGLPSEGDDPFKIPAQEVEELIATAMEPGAVVEKPLKLKTFKIGYQTVLKVIQYCFIGMLGSGDQVSMPHKLILAALMKRGPFNWNSAYLSSLCQEKRKARLTKGKDGNSVRYLRQGSRVSYMILKAVEGKQVFWSEVMPVISSNWLLKGDSTPIPSEEGVPPPSEDQPTKKPRTKTFPSKTGRSLSRTSIPTTSISTTSPSPSQAAKLLLEAAEQTNILPSQPKSLTPIKLTDETEPASVTLPNPILPSFPETSEAPPSPSEAPSATHSAVPSTSKLPRKRRLILDFPSPDTVPPTQRVILMFRSPMSSLPKRSWLGMSKPFIWLWKHVPKNTFTITSIA